MADLEFYRLSMTGEEADSGIRTGMEAGATSGVLLGDGNGGVTAATPGQDFGYPLLKGNGPPTGNTAANIGQHYFDMQATSAPYEYICVGLNANGFIWLVFGDTGNGFIISGYFASIDALNAAIAEGIVPAPTPGVNYAIGTEPPYDTVTWDGVANDWKNNGPLGASGGGSGVPPHGTTGQVLTKLSDVDGDAGWKDIALTGEGAPTASTVGMIGQLYIDTTATENPAYICVGITTADNVTTYVWQPVGGEIEASDITAALGFNPGMVNPNLIDNWYFGNPVNQRGQVSISTAQTSPYWIDRWLCGWNTTASIENGDILVNGELFQYVNADLSGKEITISALLADNSLITTTGVFTDYLAHDSGVIKLALNFGTNPSFPAFVIDSRQVDSKKFLAVKLELGSKQTLAHQENGQWVLNEIPDYGEQLARCLGYSFPVGKNGYWTLIGSLSKCIDADLLNVLIYTPVPMRGNPSVLIHGTFQENTGGKAVSSITATQIFPGAINLQCNIPGLTPGTYTLLQGREDAWLELNNNL